MASNPAFLMYYKEWLVSTAGWDADERGWFINLLCHQADKPEGLPNDIESLADLAGVKFSQFIRFKECWKRTLEAKFVANDKGLLKNKKLEKVDTERKEYSEKQAERGLIGYYVKLARKEKGINDEQAKQLYIGLSKLSLIEKTHDERDECFKRTLEAIYADADANANANEDIEIGGVGERDNFPLIVEEDSDKKKVLILVKDLPPMEVSVLKSCEDWQFDDLFDFLTKSEKEFKAISIDKPILKKDLLFQKAVQRFITDLQKKGSYKSVKEYKEFFVNWLNYHNGHLEDFLNEKQDGKTSRKHSRNREFTSKNTGSETETPL